MHLRVLLTLGLVLLLSTIASSNESRHFCGNAAGTRACSEAGGAQPSTKPTPAVSAEYSSLILNKLLYI